MNGVKTVLLLGLMSGLFLAAGQAIGGERGLVMGLGMAAAMNFFSPAPLASIHISTRASAR
jgi:heat shock protein HtpX